MKISKNSVVTLKYKLTDAQGEYIEETDEPVEYLHGGYDGIFPRVEHALEGQEPGYKTELPLEPQDAFGEYDAEQVRVEARSKFPEPIEVGMRFEGRARPCARRARPSSRSRSRRRRHPASALTTRACLVTAGKRCEHR